jgi:hypothetical protein
MGLSFIAQVASAFVMISGLAYAAPSEMKAASQQTEAQPVRFEEVFVPAGYDSNDNVQIVAEGTFADGCWSLHETPVATDLERHRITIKPSAHRSGEVCVQPAIRFQELIHIGQLPAGQYEIVQGENAEHLGQISVASASTDKVDDHTYAPVSKVEFRSENHGTGIRLSGQFSSSCMEVEDVMISVQNNVIVLQPIMNLRNELDCKKGTFPFKATTFIDFMQEGRYLLHVRTMDGLAINRIVEVR